MGPPDSGNVTAEVLGRFSSELEKDELSKKKKDVLVRFQVCGLSSSFGFDKSGLTKIFCNRYLCA